MEHMASILSHVKTFFCLKKRYAELRSHQIEIIVSQIGMKALTFTN